MSELKIASNGTYRFNGLEWVLDISNFKPGQKVLFQHRAAPVQLVAEVIKVSKKTLVIKILPQLDCGEYTKRVWPDELQLIFDRPMLTKR